MSGLVALDKVAGWYKKARPGGDEMRLLLAVACVGLSTQSTTHSDPCWSCHCSNLNDVVCNTCLSGTKENGCRTCASNDRQYSCTSVDESKYAAPYIVKRQAPAGANHSTDCCDPFLPFDPASERFKTSDNHWFVRVPGTANPPQYTSWTLPMAPQVSFVSRGSVIDDPSNQYTNYTCLNRDCRMSLVRRDESCNGGTPCVVPLDQRDDALPLCHNHSDATTCAIWEPTRGFELSGVAIGLLVVVCVAWVAFIVGIGQMSEAYGEINFGPFILLLPLAFYMLIMSCVSIRASHEIFDFAARTQVDKEYIAYHGCLRHCIQLGGVDDGAGREIAEYNQCTDRGPDCRSSTDREVVYCWSCQAQRGAFPYLERAAAALNAKVVFYGVLAALVPPLVVWIKPSYLGRRVLAPLGLLLAADEVASLVMLGFVSDGGQRQVMMYASTMPGVGDTLFAVYVVWCFLLVGLAMILGCVVFLITR